MANDKYETVHELLTEEAKCFSNCITDAWKEVGKKYPDDSTPVRFVKFHVATAKTLLQIVLNPAMSMRFAVGMIGFVLQHTSPEEFEKFREISPADLDAARSEAKRERKPDIIVP